MNLFQIQGDYFSSDDPDYNDEDYKSDDGYTEEEGVWRIDPKIISKGDTFVVDKGTTIRLPCYVDKFPGKCIMLLHMLIYILKRSMYPT